jgi:hypothetical protein
MLPLIAAHEEKLGSLAIPFSYQFDRSRHGQYLRIEPLRRPRVALFEDDVTKAAGASDKPPVHRAAGTPRSFTVDAWTVEYHCLEARGILESDEF